MPVAVLRLSHITQRFGSFTATDDISLELGAGEVLVRLGKNGAESLWPPFTRRGACQASYPHALMKPYRKGER